MKKIDLIRKSILIAAGLICAAAVCVLLLSETDIFVKAAAIFALLIILALAVITDRLHCVYMDKLLIELSDLINNVSDLRENLICSDVEDSILSRLQSQIQKLSAILAAQNRTIESERSELKTLVSDISHQIKTPVATIQMFGELLEDESLTTEQQREYFDVMFQALHKLSFLTDSLIRMTRLESGVITLAPEITGLNDMVLQAIKQVYPKAQKKEIEITFDSPAEIEAMLDKNWTAEAIFNIIDNAVKYTPKYGHVSISIQKYELFARIDITDNGRGIKENEQAQIFKRFYRADSSKNEEGIGIGLYLSRKIITDQGGYIKLKSKPGLTTFSVFLNMRLH